MDMLICNIESRFDDKSVLASFDVYNPSKLPILSENPSTKDLKMFMEYGNDEIKILATQFEGVVADSIKCLEEWSNFKQFLKLKCSKMKHKEVILKLCSDLS